VANGAAQSFADLVAELGRETDRALMAAEAIREAIADFTKARRDLQEMLKEIRRPPEPWRALNLN
jgi:hypothetical protein